MMKSFKLSISSLSIILLSATPLMVAPLRITYPTQDTVLNFSIPNNLTWKYLPTDPLYFDIQLLNTNVTYSNGFAITIKESQSSQTGFFTLPTNNSLPNGSNYQFQLISSNAALPGILAQSPNFNISTSNPLPTSYKPIDANSSSSIGLNSNHVALLLSSFILSYLISISQFDFLL